jgi:uncharacterized RDD family membrane protein YckC
MPVNLPAMEIPRDELLATRYERIFTWVLDLLIAGAIAGVGALILSIFSAPTGAYAAVGFIVGLAYGPVFLTRDGDRNGQTPGKQIVGLRVVKVDGTPMDVKTAIIRESLLKYLLGSVTFDLFLILSWAMSLGREDRRTLHDRIANTYVPRSSERWISAPAEVVPPPTAG